MRISILSILSEREYGVIAAARVEECDHPLNGSKIRLKASRSALLGWPVVGETWQIDGEVRDTQWGRQIEVQRALRELPTGKLVMSFVAAHVPGVGPERAERLWQAWSTELGKVLAGEENIPMIAKIIAPDRPNLGPSLAAACVRSWREAAAEIRTVEWLSARGVEDVRTTRRIIKILGADAVERLQSNPWVLVPLLSWAKVDQLGLQLLRDEGHVSPRTDRRRLVGAVDEIVKQMIRAGHTNIDDDALQLVVAKRLGLSQTSAIVREAIQAGIQNDAIVRGRAGWRAPGCAVLEDAIAAQFDRMMQSDYPRPVWWGGSEAMIGTGLHREQRDVAGRILASTLSVLTGGAGVGKTTVTRAICDRWEESGGTLLLATIAGKAALRLSQATGRLATTLARLIGQLQERENLEVRLQDPDLDLDCREQLQRKLAGLARIDSTTMVIVDEASMLDLASAYALIRRLPPGSRLVLVGDEGQLPPVGFGLIFHRLVRDDRIARRLITVHRQRQESGIPAVAAAIRAGQMPDIPPYAGPQEGVFWIERASNGLAPAVEQVWRDFGGASAETFVLVPTWDGDAGVHALNRRLQERASAADDLAVLKGHLGQWFSAGDRVMYLRNDYRRGLFNRLMGRVLSIDTGDRSCRVQFDGYDEPHEIGANDLIDLALAYAITCHSAQGSQAPVVIVPIYPSQVVDPSWLYTAVTRAEQQVVLLGSRKSFADALRRPWAADRRNIGFAWPAEGDGSPAPLPIPEAAIGVPACTATYF